MSVRGWRDLEFARTQCCVSVARSLELAPGLVLAVIVDVPPNLTKQLKCLRLVMKMQVDALFDRLDTLEVDVGKDVDEKFIRGSGAGGQKINKTSSMVQLIHLRETHHPLYTCLLTEKNVSIYVYMYIYVCIYIHIHIHICISIYIYIIVDICILIYVYVHKNICIHTHPFLSLSPSFSFSLSNMRTHERARSFSLSA